MKPIIFLAFSNDLVSSREHLRELPTEQNNLLEILEDADKLCEVIHRPAATVDNVFDIFQEQGNQNRIAIFHFAGHANGYSLLMSSAGDTSPIQADGLARFLGLQDGLKLVFLNACSTRGQVDELLKQGVEAVIATAQDIADDVATEFATRFYQSLVNGRSLEIAFNEADAALRATRTQGKQDNTRAFYWDKDPVSEFQNNVPWALYVRQGAEIIRDWNLPDAVDDPLFGLPPLPTLDLPQNPFRHLNWFEREHAEIFFGRGQDIRELYLRVTNPDSPPIILLYGPTGVGKSSLLDAGLRPRLEHSWQAFYERRDQNHGLLGTLLKAFATAAKAGNALRDAWLAYEQQHDKPLLVVLDQAEEIFTRPLDEKTPQPMQELDDLLQAIEVLLDRPESHPRGRLILSFRKEWLQDIETPLREQYRLPYKGVPLGPLDEKGIIEAITGPTKSDRLQQQFGLEVEDKLPERIAADLLASAGSAIAPTLQILLTNLWKQAKEKAVEDNASPRFTDQLYTSSKHQGILLADFFETKLKALAKSHPAASESGLVLDILAYHTTPQDTSAQHTEAKLREVYAHQTETLPDLLQQLESLYLLSASGSTQSPQGKTWRLAHDTLASLVRVKFEKSDSPGQRAVRIVEQRVVDWVKEDENGKQTPMEGPPLEETALAQVEQGQDGMRTWREHEVRMITASQEHRQKLEKTRRLNRLLLRIGGLVIFALLGSLGIGSWLAYEQQTRLTAEAQANEREALRAQSRFLTEKAQEAFDRKEIAHSLLLTLEALPQSEEDDRPLVFEAQSWLYNLVAQLPRVFMNTNGKPLSWSHDGMPNREALAVLEGHSRPVVHAAFSADGTRIVTASRDGTARLWPGMALETLIARVRDALGDACLKPSQRAAAFLPSVDNCPDGKLLK